jgi:hypothetical protein
MTHPLITDDIVAKAHEIVGGEWAVRDDVMRMALSAIAPDIWNAAVERCAEVADRNATTLNDGEFFAAEIRQLKQPSGKE